MTVTITLMADATSEQTFAGLDEMIFEAELACIDRLHGAQQEFVNTASAKLAITRLRRSRAILANLEAQRAAGFGSSK